MPLPLSVLLFLLVALALPSPPNHAAADDWRSYYSADGRFVLDFPDRPIPVERSLLNGEGEEYWLKGFALQRPDREWLVLFRDGAPRGFFAGETRIGGYLGRFYRDHVAEMPLFTEVLRRRRARLQEQWQGTYLLLGLRSGEQVESYSYVVDGRLYHLERRYSPSADAPASPEGERFFGSFRLLEEEAPPGAEEL